MTDYHAVREQLQQAARHTAYRPPIEGLHEFLVGISDTDGLDEFRADLERLAQGTVFGIRHDLRAIEGVLADPPPDGVLAEMVAGIGNWQLPDPSDAGARAFLRQLADIIKDVLAHANPRDGGWTDPPPA